MVDEPTLRDLEQLGRAAVEDHGDLRSCEPLALNPAFTQSLALGGADADLIADGLLLDFKSSPDRIVGRIELWQLLGYALADTEDHHQIRTAGISALRWRARAIWQVDALLEQISAGPTRPIAEWREMFATLVAASPKSRSGAATPKEVSSVVSRK